MIFICVIYTVFRIREEAASLCCLNGITTGKGLILKEKVKLIGKIDVTTNSGKNKNKKVYGPKTGVVGRIIEDDVRMNPDITI